jgi:hypothetical protein
MRVSLEDVFLKVITEETEAPPAQDVPSGEAVNA